MKTIGQAIEAVSRCFEQVGMENPRMESEFLISAFLQAPRTRLYLDRSREIDPQRLAALRKWVRAREERKPLAYISGEQPFRDLQLKVNRSVLVPRPETELLVEQALRLLDGFSDSVDVADVGTGSGNIAISLARSAKVRVVFAIDRSAPALKVARENHSQYRGLAPIRWIEGNLLAPLKTKGIKPSLIVANLPYVRTDELSGLEPELHWEPVSALDGGRDGLRIIEPCIREAGDILLPEGFLLLEIRAEHGSSVIELFEKDHRWSDATIFRDFAGLPRIAQAKRRTS